MIETLDDIVEELANTTGESGIYGSCRQVDGHCTECRICWTAQLKERLLAAFEIERKLGREQPKDES